jgi:phosphoglycerol transferase MdoB-like AlkP superfamily enzyme
MRERLGIFLRLIIFWIGFMVAARALFLAYNIDLSAQLTFGEMLQTELHGLRMDASITGYFVALAGLLLTISCVFAGRWIHYALSYINITLIVACCIIICVDMELYRNWGFRLNNTPLHYLDAGATASTSWTVVLRVLSILVVFAAFSIWGYGKFIKRRTSVVLPAAQKKSSFLILVATALLFIPIRGSFTVAPMNTGFVFFHNSKTYANHAAINVIWNFLYSLQKGKVKYPENFYDKTTAKRIVDSLYVQQDSTFHLWHAAQPNVILIILESFTADVIEPLGGIKDLTPNINALCREGILFDHFYASGDRTDKGIVATLSGYPAQPQTSIIKDSEKTQKLPSLNRSMEKLGYRSSFIYGGDIDFSNFRSYLTSSGFDHLTELGDFPQEQYTSKWGVHDHLMFERATHELDTTRTPFFKVILTLSSHEPFDVPMEPYVKGILEESLFLNSCHYTDKSLGDFIRRCKTQSWWENTVVIITADHGHRYPGAKVLMSQERFKTPLLMLGGIIKKDSVIHTVASQTDIVNTLLGQLDKPSPEFSFSKNILSKDVKPFAAFFFNDGYGFVLPGKFAGFDNPGNRFLKTEGNLTPEELDMTKAYQQVLFSDYNKK